jgi:hypothetical protein
MRWNSSLSQAFQVVIALLVTGLVIIVIILLANMPANRASRSEPVAAKPDSRPATTKPNAPPGTAPQAEPPADPERQQITEEEFFKRYEKGRTITRCAIKAEWLAKALTMPPKFDTTPGTAAPTPGDDLVILEKVDVIGNLVIGRPDPHRDEGLINVELPRRPVDLPYGLVMLDCRFTAKADLSARFRGPVVLDWCTYKGGLLISNSKFDSGCVITNCAAEPSFRLEKVDFTSSLEVTWNRFQHMTLDRCTVEGDAQFRLERGFEGDSIPRLPLLWEQVQRTSGLLGQQCGPVRALGHGNRRRRGVPRVQDVGRAIRQRRVFR